MCGTVVAVGRTSAGPAPDRTRCWGASSAGRVNLGRASPAARVSSSIAIKRNGRDPHSHGRYYCQYHLHRKSDTTHAIKPRAHLVTPGSQPVRQPVSGLRVTGSAQAARLLRSRRRNRDANGIPDHSVAESQMALLGAVDTVIGGMPRNRHCLGVGPLGPRIVGRMPSAALHGMLPIVQRAVRDSVVPREREPCVRAEGGSIEALRARVLTKEMGTGRPSRTQRTTSSPVQSTGSAVSVAPTPSEPEPRPSHSKRA